MVPGKNLSDAASSEGSVHAVKLGIIAQRLKENTTEHWLESLNAADIWCAEVLDWSKLLASEALQQLAILQTLSDGQGIKILTARLPIRLDRNLLTSKRLAP